jgi:hypothetical protein
VTQDGLEIVQPGSLVGTAATTTPGGGSIVIRPSRRRQDAPAGATAGPAGMEPAAGVVPVGSGPIGGTAAPPPPAEPAAETEGTPPP